MAVDGIQIPPGKSIDILNSGNNFLLSPLDQMAKNEPKIANYTFTEDSHDSVVEISDASAKGYKTFGDPVLSGHNSNSASDEAPNSITSQKQVTGHPTTRPDYLGGPSKIISTGSPPSHGP